MSLDTPPQGKRDSDSRRGGGDQDFKDQAHRQWNQLSAPFTMAEGKGRLKVLLVVLLVIFSLFAARLVDIQIVRGESLAAEARGLRTITQADPAERGRILDRNGVPLALSVPGRDITVDPTLVSDPKVYAAKLAPILGVSETFLEKQLSPEDLPNGPKRFAWVARTMPMEKWEEVRALDLSGIYSRPASVRKYPSASLGANFLGHTNLREDGEGYVGVAGVEQMLNAHLAGEDGFRTYEQSASGKQIPTGTARSKASTQGSSYALTIDRDIQWATQAALEKQTKALDADAMVAMVMEVKTGKVLALAQAPTADPGDKNRDPNALRNLPVEAAFEPGSTAKVITVASAVEEGKVDEKTVFKVPNRLPRGGTSFSDDQNHPDYEMTTAGILAHSSNIGTIQIGEAVGQEKLNEYHKKFGLGAPSGLGLPNENPGIILPLDQYSPTSFPTITFGQGISANLVQMATVFATVANGGVKPVPRIVNSVTRPDGTVEEAPVEEGTRVISEDTAKLVSQMMEGVVQETGTAPIANIPGYRVAGKTGTAHRYDEEVGGYKGYVASFAGFAPATNPEYVMAVTTLNPKGGNHFGSTTGGPIFKDIMTQVLQSNGVAPTAEPAPVFERHTKRSAKGGPWNR